MASESFCYLLVAKCSLHKTFGTYYFSQNYRNQLVKLWIFQNCKKQLMKFWRLRNKGKNYLKNKKQKLCKIEKNIRNMTSHEFTMFLITQHCDLAQKNFMPITQN